MNYKAMLKVVLKAIVSIAFAYYVFTKLHIDDFVNDIRQINPLFFIVAALLYMSTQLISTVRWSYFIKEKKSFKELFELYMIGTFFNLVLPGTIGGDAVKAYYLYKGTQKKGDSVVSVFLERYMGMSALMLIALMGFIFGYGYIRGTFVVPLFLIMLAGFILGTFFVLYFPYEMFHHKLKGVRLSIREYLKNKKIVLNTFFISMLVQIIGLVVVYLLGIGIGLDADLSIYTIFIPIIIVISMIPVSFSGLGVREYSFLYLFALVNVSKEKAVSLSILWFGVMIITGLMGLIYYLKRKL